MKKIFLMLILIFTLLCSCDDKSEKPLFIELENVSNVIVYLGENYNHDNVKVYVYYKSDKVDVTNEANFSSIDTNIVGTQTIYVTYLDFKANYDVEIKVKKAEYTAKLVIVDEPKIDYYVGDILDVSDLKIAVYLDDVFDSYVDLNSFSFKLKFYNKIVDSFSEIGLYEVLCYASYGEVELQTSYYVQVSANPDDEITETLSLDISKVKTEYKVNEIIDYTNLKVYIVDKNNTKYEIPSNICDFTYYIYGIEKESFDTEGEYTIKVTYGVISAFYNVNVVSNEPEKKLELNYEFANTEFIVDEEFNSYGLEIKYYEDDVLKEIVSDSNVEFTITTLGGYVKTKLDSPGTYCVQVRYKGCYAEYYIVVKRGTV